MVSTGMLAAVTLVMNSFFMVVAVLVPFSVFVQLGFGYGLRGAYCAKSEISYHWLYESSPVIYHEYAFLGMLAAVTLVMCSFFVVVAVLVVPSPQATKPRLSSRSSPTD